eukprot:1371298-Amphidinium_carterae.1
MAMALPLVPLSELGSAALVGMAVICDCFIIGTGLVRVSLLREGHLCSGSGCTWEKLSSGASLLDAAMLGDTFGVVWATEEGAG